MENMMHILKPTQLSLSDECLITTGVYVKHAFTFRLSRREEIIDALKTPMTIIDLYEFLPEISQDVIAPWVTKLRGYNEVAVIGKVERTLPCGRKRELELFSSRPEDLAGRLRWMNCFVPERERRAEYRDMDFVSTSTGNRICKVSNRTIHRIGE